MNEEWVQERTNLNGELAKKKGMEDMIKRFMEKKEALLDENSMLRDKLQFQKDTRVKRIEEKVLDKEKATDKLKKEMLEKIQVTKTGRKG